jgi:hypothetical protein
MKRGQTLIAVLTIFFILAGYSAISAQTKDQKKSSGCFHHGHHQIKPSERTCARS